MENNAKRSFARYAERGFRPPSDESEMLEHRAVAVTLAVLDSEGKSRCVEAVKYVYFYDPTEINRKGEINRRVVRFSMKRHVPVRTAYSWLATACQVYEATFEALKNAQ